MSVKNKFTTSLCINQALVCYINSFIYANLFLYGSSTSIVTLSHIGEVIGNILRAVTTLGFKYMSNTTIFTLNIHAAFLLMVSIVIFVVSVFMNFNFNLCVLAWFINRVCNSIVASCRDTMLYRLNLLYNIDVNVPMVKTIKSIGNFVNLLKLVLITGTFFSIKAIYYHYMICIFACFVNIISCYILYVYSIELDKCEIDVTKLKTDAILIDAEVLKYAAKILVVTILLNVAQVDNAIVFFKLANRNMVVFLKQCIGQVGLGIIYSYLFRNSRCILFITPLIHFMFHYMSYLEYNYIGVAVMGIQTTIKNTFYVVLAMILCPYNQIYPAVCIIADAISIAISNFLFVALVKQYGYAYTHKVFLQLGIFAFICGVTVALFTRSHHTTKTSKTIKSPVKK